MIKERRAAQETVKVERFDTEKSEDGFALKSASSLMVIQQHEEDYDMDSDFGNESMDNNPVINVGEFGFGKEELTLEVSPRGKQEAVAVDEEAKIAAEAKALEEAKAAATAKEIAAKKEAEDLAAAEAKATEEAKIAAEA